MLQTACLCVPVAPAPFRAVDDTRRPTARQNQTTPTLPHANTHANTHSPTHSPTRKHPLTLCMCRDTLRCTLQARVGIATLLSACLPMVDVSMSQIRGDDFPFTLLAAPPCWIHSSVAALKSKASLQKYVLAYARSCVCTCGGGITLAS